MPNENAMIPAHLDLPWRVDLDDGEVSVVTDVPRTGPFYFVCHIYECLPGDNDCRKTAQHICDCHNKTLKPSA